MTRRRQVGIGALSASAAMAYSAVQPVIATLLAALFLDEAITTRSRAVQCSGCCRGVAAVLRVLLGRFISVWGASTVS